MADFFSTAINDNTFIRGAARLMWAGTTVNVPTTIGDIINLSTYAAQSGWNDLGATKTGVTVVRNNTEEVFDVDQILGNIDTRPVDWEQTVTTALAEASLQRMQIAWEGGSISTGGGEETMGVGNPLTYTKRRLAVLILKADGKIRAHVYRLVTRGAVESSAVFNKTGDQVTFPVQFRALADTSVSDVNTRVGVVINQV